MSHSAEDYAAQLAALLPVGDLWDWLREDPLMVDLLGALAEEFARCDGRIEQLIDESDPRTTLELLPEWESFAGLPDACSDLGATVAQRQEALRSVLTAYGGQSRQYFIDLASQLGFPSASITEYDPHTVDMTVDAPIYGADWRFAWKLSAPTPAVSQFTVDSTVDESLGEQSPTTRLECTVNRYKPAHTTAIFAYTT